MRRFSSGSKRGPPATGDKESDRIRSPRSSQAPKDFDTHKGAHAVTENSERPVEIRPDCRDNLISQERKPSRGRLGPSQASSLILDGKYLERNAQPLLPNYQ